jgi:hypothetical protein
MISSLENAVTHAANMLDRVRNDLKQDVGILGTPPSSVMRDRRANLIASSYIWIAATLEQYTKSIYQILASEINQKQIPHNKLKHCLFAIICHSDFDALQQLRGLKMRDRRVNVFAKLDENSIAQLNLEEIPLDGRTIRHNHLEAIWKTFGIEGPSLPGPRHRFALEDLANGRNQVAHGETDPITFGRSKASGDVLQLVNFIEDVVIHVTEAIDKYLGQEKYLR